MGTDIHGVWQKKTKSGWEDIESNYKQKRDYYLFSWIAGVRNGYGFAGIPTYEPVTPIAECRGLPDDFFMDGEVHKNSAEEELEVWMGEHSFSWISAEEVIANEVFCKEESVKYFVDECIRLRCLHGNVRFVFGFDS